MILIAKQQVHVGFLPSVAFWVGFSVLCWRVLMRAFCKVVLAGAR